MNMAGTSYWENEDNQNEEDQLEIDEEDENDSYSLPGQLLRSKNVNGEDVERGGDESEEEEGEEEEEEYSSLEEESDEGSDAVSWISYWCSIMGHEYFTEVPESFIEDQFNLTGLHTQVPFYAEALTMILDGEYEEYTKPADIQIVENSAEMLYGLIHQRWIISPRGLQAMADKYEHAAFGHCPRVFCHSTAVIPMGRSDCQAIDTVKLFCPSCLDIYTPPQTRFHGIDGAYFGSTFPHLFFQTYPELLPTPGPQPRYGMRIYVPRIYGFKVNERAKNGPRMQWLRMIPSEEARQSRRGIRRYFELQGESIEVSEGPENGDIDDEDDDDDPMAEDGDDGLEIVGEEEYEIQED